MFCILPLSQGAFCVIHCSAAGHTCHHWPQLWVALHDGEEAASGEPHSLDNAGEDAGCTGPGE